MKLPFISWNKTIRNLGYKVVRKKTRSNPRNSRVKRAGIEYGSLEPRRFLAGDLTVGLQNGQNYLSLGETVTLDLTSYSTADGALANWEVAWGDGQVTTGNGRQNSVTHGYEVPGNYSISVTTTSENGLVDTTSLEVDGSFGDSGKVLVAGSSGGFEEAVGEEHQFTFDGASFKSTTEKKNLRSAEYFPVDQNSAYRLSIEASSGDGQGGSVNSAAKHYLGFIAYDIDKKYISPYQYHQHAGSTDTRLARALEAGDTEIRLDDASGWHNGTARSARTIAWYGYADSTGHVYEDYTYTQNYRRNLWDAGAVNGNIITLRDPWDGPTIAKGTAVRNTQSHHTYNYLLGANREVGEATEKISAVLGGVHDQQVHATYRPGTAYIRGWC